MFSYVHVCTTPPPTLGPICLYFGIVNRIIYLYSNGILIKLVIVNGSCASILLSLLILQILEYEKLSSLPARRAKAKAMYDKFIYADMLAMDSVWNDNGK